MNGGHMPRQKTTRRVRMRVDMTIEFDNDLTTLPFGEADDQGRITTKIAEALREVPGTVQIVPGTTFRFNLDSRGGSRKTAASGDSHERRRKNS